MELKDALLRRRSVRKFTKETVSDEMIEEILHAGMSGPSASNKMPWEFYVVTNNEILSALKGLTRYTRMDAPLAIIVCGNLSRVLPMQLSDYWIQDCSAATENILLRVTDLSLGAVWCGIHPQKRSVAKVQKLLGLPTKHIPLNVIFIGHPAEFPEARDQYNKKRIHFVK